MSDVKNKVMEVLRKQMTDAGVKVIDMSIEDKKLHTPFSPRSLLTVKLQGPNGKEEIAMFNYKKLARQMKADGLLNDNS